MPADEDEPTFGQRMRDKNIGLIGGSGDGGVTEGRREDGVRWQRVRTDQGHEITEHADGRRDVTVNL